MAMCFCIVTTHEELMEEEEAYKLKCLVKKPIRKYKLMNCNLKYIFILTG